MRLKPLKSPCVDVCLLEANGECKGCRRTGHEIANWIAYSDAERDAVLAQLPARRAVADSALTASTTAKPS
jgi:predicted Fe-S protein YdhL (DUF1289 family)